MANSLDLEIAGIRFSVERGKCFFLQQPEPAYRSFLEEGDRDPARMPADIRIRLQPGHIPGIEKLDKFFDSGQSWSMFQDGTDRVIALKPPGFDQPFWVARMKPNFAEATIYLSERMVNRKNGRIVLSNPVSYPLDQILLMYTLARRRGALLHAAGIEVDGKGYIFPGKSGAGKSTITGQFASKKKIGLISDDRIVVRKMDGGFRAYGTPWPGEAGIAFNKDVALSGIFFLHHGPANRIKEIALQEGLERILPVTSIPWYDREIMPRILAFCEDLISHVPLYELCFKPSVEVVDVFEQFIAARP
ncbi:MAG: hypothetical protein B1H12_11255 [Desulfobacteraceae bacterium 4484_190.2]|nr:MAG: hypothetical protein B1H12_11255 [Desulfobacteraceae bacterium 4484_190.2]